MSRLLIVQSKRLLLASSQRRRRYADPEVVERRAQVLRAELDEALDRYRRTMLSLGVPEDSDYWVAAYGKLIDTANNLVDRMRHAAVELGASDRYTVSGDVEALESLVDRWRDAMRLAITNTAA
jgi:hypothetical protein